MVEWYLIPMRLAVAWILSIGICLGGDVAGAADALALLRPVLPATEIPRLSASLLPPQLPTPPGMDLPQDEGPEYRACNEPSFSVDAALTNDNRRTTGLVLGEGGYTPPVQQTGLSGTLGNVWCQNADIEFSGWYSADDFSDLRETRVTGRVIVEVMPRVRVYGGIASWDNPEGLYRPNSLFAMLGSEYPSLWGTTFNADYKRDLRENGDWLTMMFSKSHEIGRTDAGAIFSYKQGLGATITRQLPGNIHTPEINGVPSAFYRAALEIDDGPVTWYVEASPHVSFVSRATGVRKHHVLVTAGLRFTLP